MLSVCWFLLLEDTGVLCPLHPFGIIESLLPSHPIRDVVTAGQTAGAQSLRELTSENPGQQQKPSPAIVR